MIMVRVGHAAFVARERACQAADEYGQRRARDEEEAVSTNARRHVHCRLRRLCPLACGDAFYGSQRALVEQHVRPTACNQLILMRACGLALEHVHQAFAHVKELYLVMAPMTRPIGPAIASSVFVRRHPI